jgi:biotin carboxyl carrier protein
MTQPGPEAEGRSVDRGEDQRQLARVADEVLPRLISRFGASGLGELEIRQTGWRVRMRRAANGEDEMVAAPRRGAKHGRHGTGGDGQRPDGSTVVAGSGSAGSGTAVSGSPMPGDGGASPSDRGRVVVTSPAVGYFVPLTDREAGTAVRQGELLGHVDVLGVRQDVVASSDGIVRRILAESGEAVEYGQSLVRIDRTDRLEPTRTDAMTADVPA